jgi:hypothetical protein
VIEVLEYDDSESPAIGVLDVGVTWEDVEDHIKIQHQPLLLIPEGSDEYTGVYWSNAAMVRVGDLGSDTDEAIGEFREYLRQRGET